MSVEENKEVVLRMLLARNAGDLDGFLSLLPDEWHEGATAAFNAMTNAFPDLKIKVDNLLGEDDKVAAQWTLTGTHGGDYQKIPPTHKQITIEGIDILTVEKGKIKSMVRRTNDLDLLKQLGVTLSWEGEVIT